MTPKGREKQASEPMILLPSTGLLSHNHEMNRSASDEPRRPGVALRPWPRRRPPRARGRRRG